VWDTFCDWYIELAKSRLYNRESAEAKTARRVLVWCLTGILKLLHPYMPFITEEIFLALPHVDESIMISAFPAYDEALSFPTDEENMDRIIDAIRAIRNRRAEMNVPPSRRANLYVTTRYADAFTAAAPFFEKLASAQSLHIVDAYDGENAVKVVTDAATISIPMGDLVDLEKEKARMSAERERIVGEIARVEKKLANEGFVSKAPAAVVEGERAKLGKYRETLAQLDDAIAKLN
jgi:valyl-tRNA synthetase